MQISVSSSIKKDVSTCLLGHEEVLLFTRLLAQGCTQEALRSMMSLMMDQQGPQGCLPPGPRTSDLDPPKWWQPLGSRSTTSPLRPPSAPLPSLCLQLSSLQGHKYFHGNQAVPRAGADPISLEREVALDFTSNRGALDTLSRQLSRERSVLSGPWRSSVVKGNTHRLTAPLGCTGTPGATPPKPQALSPDKRGGPRDTPRAAAPAPGSSGS